MQFKKNLVVLFAVPVLMFGFGYLMVPIYDLFCEITGLNGKTGSTTVQRVGKMRVDESRLIKVEFMANLNQAMPLDFTPAARSMMAHPGKTYRATYHARNRRDAAMTGQAVPSVSPSKASAWFNKTECFCFGRQDFAAGEQRELPLVFVIHPDLPEDVETITLSYTFFEVDAPEPDRDRDRDRDHDHDHDHDHAHEPDPANHDRVAGAAHAPAAAPILNL